MPASKDAITRLCANCIVVGRYLAQKDAGYEASDLNMRAMNGAAQLNGLEELAEYAEDAIKLADHLERHGATDEWARLTGRGEA